jgi:hypothetical protein
MCLSANSVRAAGSIFTTAYVKRRNFKASLGSIAESMQKTENPAARLFFDLAFLKEPYIKSYSHAFVADLLMHPGKVMHIYPACSWSI